MIRQFIRMILEANIDASAEAKEINNLLQNIVDKFPQAITFAPGPRAGTLANDKLKEYSDRYYSDEEFQALVNKSRIYRCDKFNISFLNAKVVQQYLRDELKAFDVLIYFDDKIHEISYEKLKRLLFIAETCGQFEVMVKRIAKKVI